MTSNKQFIAIIDFGSQYSHLITKVLRELNIVTRQFTPTAKVANFKNVAGIILSGGPKSLLKNPVKFNYHILKLNVPILGVCYGHQLLANHCGGQLTASQIREYGPAQLTMTNTHRLFDNIPALSQVWMSHGDSVTKLPPGFITLAKTKHLPIAAMASATKPILGIQFHPEVKHTKYGHIILQNFATNICKIKTTNQPGQQQEIIKQINRQVGGRKVFMLVSGGVDSTVAFALLNKALGKDRVYGLHIDTGLMRKNESREVQKNLKQIGLTNLHVLNGKKLFLQKLRLISNPETKRLIIGQTFLRAVELILKKLKFNKVDWLLGQGTIYPDTIESGGSKHADKIKTHHNRIGRLEQMAKQGLLMEPLKKLYKDEVRKIGEELNLPKDLIWCHPFPGPGLAVRILCLNKKEAGNLNLTPSRIANLKLAHHILPIKSVGVQGDERSYAHPLAIKSGYKDLDKLTKLATKLTNENKIINRVILKLTGPNLNLGKAHEAYLNLNRIKLLQAIDATVTDILKSSKLYYKIWQCPTILIPFGYKHKNSLVLRPFVSREAMTGQAYRLPDQVIKKIIGAVKKYRGLDYIFYDLTNKPPSTIEWE